MVGPGSTVWRMTSGHRRTPHLRTNQVQRSIDDPGHLSGTTGSARSPAPLERGLVLTTLVEHDSCPWDGLPGQVETIATDSASSSTPAPTG